MIDVSDCGRILPAGFALRAWIHPVAGAETTETLTVTLRAEGDDWRIQEIRSAH